MENTVFKKIAEIIKADFKNSFIGGNVILQDSTSREIKINKTGNFLCIQPDKIIDGWRNNFPFFETSIPDLCKISDHLIIYPKTNTLFVFIIELKSTNTTGALKQVRASFELSKYICGTAKRMLNNPSMDIKYRGLIFSHKTFKGTTKPKNSNYREDNNSELMYQHLQSGNSFDLDILSI
jgi:hypothetical protein